MDVIIPSLLILAAIGWSGYRDLEIKREIQQLRKELHEAKQARMKAIVSSRQTPHIDSRARTTKRDSGDLPRTGRMSSTTSKGKTDGNHSDG